MYILFDLKHVLWYCFPELPLFIGISFDGDIDKLMFEVVYLSIFFKFVKISRYITLHGVVVLLIHIQPNFIRIASIPLNATLKGMNINGFGGGSLFRSFCILWT